MLKSALIMVSVAFSLIICYQVGQASANGSGAEVTLYTRPSFQGKSRDIYLEPGKCFPLFGIWSSNVGSIKLDSGTCIKIYNNPTCSGRPKLLDGQYADDRDQAANLALAGLLYRVESLEMC